jgi:ribonuclease III family protein
VHLNPEGNADSDVSTPAQLELILTLPVASQWATFKPAQLQQISPAALAYIGDAVYELYVRTHYLLPPQKLQRYHDKVVSQVRAESQADHLRSLEPHLTPDELDLLRRGRNAASKRFRRGDPEVYQRASSLETLIGYLYLVDPKRLTYLLTQLPLEVVSASSV